MYICVCVIGYRYRPLGAESYRLMVSIKKKVLVHPYFIWIHFHFCGPLSASGLQLNAG